MNWRAVDLNLLVVFDAIVKTKSATRAAARLNMTQSTVSHALTRLRSALQDELFVRTPNGMKPTPHAERIAGPVSAALEMLSTALGRVGTFDPKTSQRRFLISADNSAALNLSVPLAAAAAAEAPGIEISILPSGTLDNEGCLERGEVDLAVGGFARPPSTSPIASCSSMGSLPWSAAATLPLGMGCSAWRNSEATITLFFPQQEKRRVS